MEWKSITEQMHMHTLRDSNWHERSWTTKPPSSFIKSICMIVVKGHKSSSVLRIHFSHVSILQNTDISSTFYVLYNGTIFLYWKRYISPTNTYTVQNNAQMRSLGLASTQCPCSRWDWGPCPIVHWRYDYSVSHRIQACNLLDKDPNLNIYGRFMMVPLHV